MLSQQECQSSGCSNRTAKYRRLCPTCRSRKYKREHPFRYFYNSHRQSAKARCIPWNLSFEEFKKIWKQSGHWDEKRFSTQMSSQSWSMQRKNVNKGYEYGNVKIIRVILNVQLWHDEEKWHVDFRWREMWSKRNSKPIEDCPF